MQRVFGLAMVYLALMIALAWVGRTYFHMSMTPYVMPTAKHAPTK